MENGATESNVLDTNDEETSELVQCKGVLIINSKNQQTITQPIEVEFVPRNDGNKKTIYECHVSRLKSTNEELPEPENMQQSYLPEEEALNQDYSQNENLYKLEVPGPGTDDRDLIPKEEEEETPKSEDTSTSTSINETTLSSDLDRGVNQSEDAHDDDASPDNKSIAISTEEDNIFSTHSIESSPRTENKNSINSTTIKAIRIKRTARLFGNIKEIDLLLSNDDSESSDSNRTNKKRKSSKANRKYSYYDLDLLDKKRLIELSGREEKNFSYNNRDPSIYTSRVQHRFIPDDEFKRRKMKKPTRVTAEKSTNVDEEELHVKSTKKQQLGKIRSKTDAATSIPTVEKLSENPESRLRFEIIPNSSNRNLWKPQECLSSSESKSSKLLMECNLEKNSNDPALSTNLNKVSIALQKNKSQQRKRARIVKSKDEGKFPVTSTQDSFFSQSVHVLHSKDDAILKKSFTSKDQKKSDSRFGDRQSLAKSVRMESQTSMDSRKRKIAGYLFHTPIRRIRSRTMDLFVRPMDFFEHPNAKNIPDDQLDPQPLLRIIESNEVFKKTATEHPKPGDKTRVPQDTTDEKIDLYGDHEDEADDWVSPGELIRQQKLANLKQYQKYKYVIYASEKPESRAKLDGLEMVYTAKDGKKATKNAKQTQEAKSQETSKLATESNVPTPKSIEESKQIEELGPKDKSTKLKEDIKSKQEQGIETTKPEEEPITKDVKSKKVPEPKETSSLTEGTKLENLPENASKLEEAKPKEAQKIQEQPKVKDEKRKEKSKPTATSKLDIQTAEKEPDTEEIKSKEEAITKNVKHAKVSKPKETSNLTKESKLEKRAPEKEPEHEVKPKGAPAPAPTPKSQEAPKSKYSQREDSKLKETTEEQSTTEKNPKLEETKPKEGPKSPEPAPPKYKEKKESLKQNMSSSLTERHKLGEKQTEQQSRLEGPKSKETPKPKQTPKSKEVIYKDEEESKLEKNKPKEQQDKGEPRSKRTEPAPPPKEMGEMKPREVDEHKPEEVAKDKSIKKGSRPHFEASSGTMQAAAKQKDGDKIKKQTEEKKSAKFHTASQEEGHDEQEGEKINVVFTKDKKESETELDVPMKIVFK